ncbi:hypothetical protein [Pseudomonas sp. NPDC089569]|uniref:hypothetical protein n=1 Tax=Pseudomonas sp. NPDC089569 TaxID=3390722 RepID=UPI003D07D918
MLTASRQHQILASISGTTLGISAAAACLIGTFSKSISFYPTTATGEDILIFVVLFVPMLIASGAVKLTLMAVQTHVSSESDSSVETIQRNQTLYLVWQGSLLWMLVISQRLDPSWMNSVSYVISPEHIQTLMFVYCVMGSFGLIVCSLRNLFLELKSPLCEHRTVAG